MSLFYLIDDVANDSRQREEDVIVLAAAGDIDYSASPQLREQITDHIDAGKRRLVLDLTQVTFIDSTAIGVLIGAHARLQDAGGGSVVIVCSEENRKVQRIFEIAGVDSVIALHDTREEALSALAVAR